MWKIKSIRIKDICTLKDVEYTFGQNITTLVFGNNLDNNSQKNNGSGKSALMEAIVFGLTGAPLRQVKNDELINNDEDQAYVKIQLENTSSDTIVEIERTIYRKGSPDIVVTMYRNGTIIEDSSTVKSGVDEYNKYILDLIGLTKEEIYNCFILSKHRYQDFLSASDRDKKDIINKFSNGNLVDQSIQVVQADKKPLLEQFDEKKLELSNLEGRVSATEEQIENEKRNSELRQQTKAQRIQDAKNQIKDNKHSILTLEQDIDKLKLNQSELNSIGDELNNLDESTQSKLFDDILNEINSLLSKTDLISFDSEKSNKIREEISNQIALKTDELEKLNNNLIQVETDYLSKKSAVKHFQDGYVKEKKSYDQFLSDFETNKQRHYAKQVEINDKIKSSRARVNSNKSIISDLEAKLSGSIECPHCKKHFILEDKEFNIENAHLQIKHKTEDNDKLLGDISKLLEKVNNLDKDLEELNKSKSLHYSSLESIEKELKIAEKIVYAVEEEIQKIKRTQEHIESDIKDLKQKQDQIINNLFDDIFNEISRSFTRISNSIKTANESISNFNGIIEAKKELINRLETEDDDSIISSLKTSLKEYKKKRALVYKKQIELETQINTLNTQEARFIAFKTYLANSKVEALNEITNNFLEQIGSDLRVRFDGYTMLKSGKIRDKISVSLLRDGIDTGSFAKFSEGEKTRIQLATILAMNTLTNNNAERDKGLDLLILDEILSAVDEEGLSYILESLNKLKMTALVVSHGKTSESYPHKLVITKQNGISTING